MTNPIRAFLALKGNSPAQIDQALLHNTDYKILAQLLETEVLSVPKCLDYLEENLPADAATILTLLRKKFVKD